MQKDMHKADIIAALRKKGLSLTSLAINNQLNKYACRQALHRPYAAAEEVIAEALGVPVQKIWPSRYNDDGTRKKYLHSKLRISQESDKILSNEAAL